MIDFSSKCQQLEKLEYAIQHQAGEVRGVFIKVIDWGVSVDVFASFVGAVVSQSEETFPTLLKHCMVERSSAFLVR